ncbi:hypothetical protein [Streptomyces sp. FH025]|uniref:hypothetical protein n=1 Tax=Streptomyces sp. FH025 TaxID=2815937 RepID=UPI001A9DEF93|nr:hypothetical protein [Streptomyces sp. FH025]MBO1413017.1 hypothetical protein [Streptomyces sp. FH025]
MANKLSEIGSAFRSNLYEILSGFDSKTKPVDKDSFITWCSPGLPFDEGDFDFAEQGLVGSDSAQTKRLALQAYNFARLVDFIPSANGVYDGIGVWKLDDGSRLSTVYGQILKQSQLAKSEVSSSEKEAIENAKKYLYTTVSKKTPQGTTKNIKVDTDDYSDYKDYKDKYLKAVRQYNLKRIAANTAAKEDSASVLDWQLNGQTYRAEMEAAWDDWVSKGNKKDVEDALDTLTITGERSLKSWRTELGKDLKDSEMTGLADPLPFQYTTVVPSGFATAKGWTEYSLSHYQISEKKISDTKDWQANAGANWGFWNSEGSTKHHSEQHSEDMSVDDFALSFKLTQVQIIRSWFSPEFLESHVWKLPQNSTLTDVPSDGGKPPKGSFVAYPLQMFVVKDVVITSKALAEAARKEIEEHKTSGSVGWGPFAVSGSYVGNHSSDTYECTIDGASIKIPGMQIIGFRNHLFGRMPDPNSKITEWE